MLYYINITLNTRGILDSVFIPIANSESNPDSHHIRIKEKVASSDTPYGVAISLLKETLKGEITFSNTKEKVQKKYLDDNRHLWVEFGKNSGRIFKFELMKFKEYSNNSSITSLVKDVSTFVNKFPNEDDIRIRRNLINSRRIILESLKNNELTKVYSGKELVLE